MDRARGLLVSFGALLTLCVMSCQTIEPQALEYTAADMPCSQMSGNSWESSPIVAQSGCQWLTFPPQSTITLSHPLARLPVNAALYLSFDSSGRPSTLASGDLGLIVDGSATVITFQNNTNESFFARVVLE